MKINHFNIVKDILGFKDRLVIWVAGCPFSCDGCIAEELQNFNNGKDYNYQDLSNKILSNQNKFFGITFTGGEPLAQADELFLLLNLIKNFDKMLFTGYIKSELNEIQLKCYEMFDLVVEGRFDKNKMGNFLWRGSSNQIITSPTSKYQNILKDLSNSKSAGLEVSLIENQIYYYGIPTNNNEIEILENQLIN